MPVTIPSYSWQKENLDAVPCPHRKHEVNQIDKNDPTGFFKRLNTVGLYIWRYQQEDLVSVAREEYGHFCCSELYVIVHVVPSLKTPGTKLRHIHMWAGKNTSFVNYKTTMMKIIELDTFVEDTAILYREVQDKESEMFKSYFETITYWMDGHRETYREMLRRKQKFRARLLEFYKPMLVSNYYCANEIIANKRLLDPSHAFILDAGDQLIQWNGSLCTSEDVIACMNYVQTLNANRGGTLPVIMVDEKDKNDEMGTFYHHLSTTPINRDNMPETPEIGDSPLASWKRALGLTTSRSKFCLYQLILKKGVQQFRLIKKGDISWKDLKKQGNYMLDTGEGCYLWIRNSDPKFDLKATALQLIHNFLNKQPENSLQPIIVFSGEHVRCIAFETALGPRF